MRDPLFNADALRVYGRLALEAAALSDIHSRSPKAAKSHGRRSLRLEPLEARHLLDAGGAASLISAVWFQDVSDQSAAAHAGVADWTTEGLAASEESDLATAGQADVYDWIVQFDTASVAGMSSLTETAKLLTGGGIDFEVLRGLGLVGQALVRSSNASIEAAADWLSENTYITSFEQDAISQVDTSVPTDPLYNQLWGMTMIDAPRAWSLSTGSSSVVVAVVDTGVDYTHVDLAANMWTNPGEIAGNGIDDDGNGFVDDVHGYDFANNDSDPMDDNAHGTHVSGTIAAAANNGLGVAGVNWSSSIMALKFLNSGGSGYSSDAVRAINYATMMRTQYGVNVRVMNNSWGGAGYSYAMYNAIEASNNADILFIAAAGNSGSNNDASPQYPANYTNSNVISVAAVSQSGQLASFSSYGATTVDLAAPGVSIYSTIPGNRYAAYSGTSMATPHVAGVAALAFAYAPDATAAQVRDAMLGGTEYSSALAGKTATGGILNALGTLELLADQMHGPAISYLTVSPSSVMSGDSATLTAHGVTDSTGDVTRVYFYLDANSNSQIDAGDSLVGSTSAITDGEASVSFNTSGYAAGSHGFLATAVDNHGEYSAATGATLAVLPADDYGDAAATAGAVAVPSSTQATLGVAGDVDWFAFQAVAGKSYTFSTELNTLEDSTLSLYNRNGTEKLRYNDDIGPGNLASSIQWTASYSGTYYLAVASYHGIYAGSYTLNVLVDNSAPVLPTIADQSMSHSQTTLTVPINASDADGDPLAYSVEVYSVDAMSVKAYDLDQQYDLYRWHGSFWTNTRGQGEKYIASYANGTASPLLIFPNGELYQWEGSMDGLTYLTTLSVEYYNDPFLLCNAQSPDYSPVGEADVQARVNNGVLTLTRSADFQETLLVELTVSDGMAASTESFQVEVTNSAPELAPIADQTMSHRNTTLSLDTGASDADGDTLQYTVAALAVDPMARTAYDLDQQYDLYQWHGSFWTNTRGQGEKYIASYTNGTASPLLIFPNGEVYEWGGSMDELTYITTLTVDYYNDPFLLCNAQMPDYSPVDAADVQFSVNAGVLTITRAADYQNSFIVQLAVSDGAGAASESFLVSVTNSAPELASIADQTMSSRTTTLSLRINASDADGDTLQCTAVASGVDSMAQAAYDLDQQYDLYQWHGSFWYDTRGQGEKYIASYANGTAWPLLIFPNGEVYQWGGSMGELTYITTLSTDYYNDPFLLSNAQMPSSTALSSETVAVGMQGNLLTISRDIGYNGDFQVQVSVTDGVNTSSETFDVSVLGAASLQSMSAFAETPSALPSLSSISDGLAAKSPDLRAIWSNYYADSQLSFGKESLSLGVVASRFDEVSNMLREDVFSRLSPADDSPAASEDALLDEIVASISSLRREVDGMLFGHDDFGLRDSLEDDAVGRDFRLGESLERNAADSFHESFAEQFDLPTVLS